MIPVISGYYAYTHGRSFWLWFFIGCILPVFSYFILLLLPDKKDLYDEELHNLRIKLGILGIKPDVPNHDIKLKKILKKKTNNIYFKIIKDATASQSNLEIIIDNVRLQDWFKNEPSKGKKVMNKEYFGVPLSVIKFPSYHLLGYPEPGFSDDKKSALLICIESQSDIDVKQSFIFVKIEVLPTCIIWRDFSKDNHLIKLKDEQTNAFLFNKVQYIDALQEISKEFHL
ncbi:MAG: hypothetical protein OHK0038_07690 [Flammeovirgaceae bacterium]